MNMDKIKKISTGVMAGLILFSNFAGAANINNPQNNINPSIKVSQQMEHQQVRKIGGSVVLEQRIEHQESMMKIKNLIHFYLANQYQRVKQAKNLYQNGEVTKKEFLEYVDSINQEVNEDLKSLQENQNIDNTLEHMMSVIDSGTNIAHGNPVLMKKLIKTYKKAYEVVQHDEIYKNIINSQKQLFNKLLQREGININKIISNAKTEQQVNAQDLQQTETEQRIEYTF